MRLQQNGQNNNNSKLEEFSNWILKVGDGKLSEPNDGYADIDIPPELLVTNFDDPLEAIVRSTYPEFYKNYMNEDFLQSRAILAGTIEIVDAVNQYMLGLIPGNLFLIIYIYI
jgi:ATP-dependent DNA helicase PIF1